MGDIENVQHRRVVVGVDGSPNSVTALRQAAQAALRLGTDLDIVLALGTEADDTALADAARGLDALVRREFPGGLGTPSRREVEPGDPAVVLLRASFAARLLVLGAPEHVRPTKSSGRSTVSRCVESARCPVEICADAHESAA